MKLSPDRRPPGCRLSHGSWRTLAKAAVRVSATAGVGTGRPPRRSVTDAASAAVSPLCLPPVQFEFMIESILYARDAWLKEGGVIWPTTAALHLVPCSADRDYRSKVLFWDNAYEFNLSALK